MDRERRDVVGPLLATVLHMVITRNVAKRRQDPLIVAIDELPTLYLPTLVQWLNEKPGRRLIRHPRLSKPGAAGEKPMAGNWLAPSWEPVPPRPSSTPRNTKRLGCFPTSWETRKSATSRSPAIGEAANPASPLLTRNAPASCLSPVSSCDCPRANAS